MACTDLVQRDEPMSTPNDASFDNTHDDENCSAPLSAPAQPPVNPPAAAPQQVSKKALKLLGAEMAQVGRSKAMKQLGMTEYDLSWVDPLFETPEQRERSRELYEKLGYSPKLLSLTGMSESQIMRRKALLCMGITEHVLQVEREKRLEAWSPGVSHANCDYPCVHLVNPTATPLQPLARATRSLSTTVAALPFPGASRRLSVV
jgi:hypothetical protein